ncbi:MAG: RNA ligase family protein [Rhodospirillaceae bacterium]
MSDFFRFPHTPHIAWLGEGTPRDDKVLEAGEASAFLDGEVVVEEKVDGANLGFSVSPDGELRAQNRGHYLERPFSGQFSRLESWLAPREDALFDALAAAHSGGAQSLLVASAPADQLLSLKVAHDQGLRAYGAPTPTAVLDLLDVLRAALDYWRYVFFQA